jgi:hypothetical protein
MHLLHFAVFGSEALASHSCFNIKEAFGGAKAPLPIKSI